jgi:hypothetical protein
VGHEEAQLVDLGGQRSAWGTMPEASGDRRQTPAFANTTTETPRAVAVASAFW